MTRHKLSHYVKEKKNPTPQILVMNFNTFSMLELGFEI